MLRLWPRDSGFFDGFEAMSRYATEAAGLLHDLVFDFRDTEKKLGAIREVEHRADQVTHSIVTRLNTTFVTPIDRGDVHALASRLDDVLDYIDAAAAALVVYGVKEPTSQCRAFAGVVIETVAPMNALVECVRRFDRGFAAHAIEVHRHENRADALLRESLAVLFETADPISVLKWKDIYETMEGITDRCEDVANTIEGILLKNA